LSQPEAAGASGALPLLFIGPVIDRPFLLPGINAYPTLTANFRCMSADRLAELLRQRALLHEHLAWLDAEIAAASGPAATASATAPPAVAIRPATTAPRLPAPVAPAAAAIPAPALAPPVGTAPTPGLTEASAEAILSEYQVKPDNLRQDVRKGCLLYFAASFVLLGLGVLGLYFALRGD